MKHARKTLLLVMILAVTISPRPARALSLDLPIGFSAGADLGYTGFFLLSPSFGLNIVHDFTQVVSIGVFGSDNVLFTSPGGAASHLIFFGGLVRAGLPPMSKLFFDGQIGGAMKIGGGGARILCGVGLGVGYRFHLKGRLGLAPRLGWRILPTGGGTSLGTAGATQTLFDLGVSFSLDLYHASGLIGWSGGGGSI
ncbi:MAG: hypothetical protein ACXWPM_00205 [Bdellovibrionota bacterium]